MGRKDKTISTGQDALVLLGARLRKARQDKGVRLSDLAEALDYTKGHLSAVENGKGRPSRELVQAYEDELGLQPGELMPMHMDARQKVALSRRRSPISVDILALLGDDSKKRQVEEARAAPVRGRGLRLGSGLPVSPESKEEILRDVLRHIEEAAEAIRVLLKSEDKGA